jgi:transposase/IS5 family transposase
MGQVFRPYDPDQTLMFPPSVREWIAEGHLAHFVSDSVDQLDVGALYARYEEREDGRGELAYEPRMMLKVLIYAYATGIFSSRKIARAIDDLVALRYLAAGNRPSHRTIARFREENLKEFGDLFTQVVRVARAAGLVKMGTLALDGSKLKANASKHKAMSYGRMKETEKKLRDEIERITKRAQSLDAAEDKEFGPDFRGDELPQELQRRETRLAKIREAMKRLEDEQARQDQEDGRGQYRPGTLKRPNGVAPDKKQSNFTDPESGLMKTASGGFEQCYNAQLAVDSEKQIIVAADVTACAADNGELLPMEEQAEKNADEKTKIILADSGYKGEANFQALEERGVDAYVSLGKGEELGRAGTAPCTQRMDAKMRSEQGRQRFKRRKAIVEPVYGWIKQVLGFRAFSMRGIAKARAEWNLVSLVVNLRRMATLGVAMAA